MGADIRRVSVLAALGRGACSRAAAASQCPSERGCAALWHCVQRSSSCRLSNGSQLQRALLASVVGRGRRSREVCICRAAFSAGPQAASVRVCVQVFCHKRSHFHPWLCQAAIKKNTFQLIRIDIALAMSSIVGVRCICWLWRHFGWGVVEGCVRRTWARAMPLCDFRLECVGRKCGLLSCTSRIKVSAWGPPMATLSQFPGVARTVVATRL